MPPSFSGLGHATACHFFKTRKPWLVFAQQRSIGNQDQALVSNPGFQGFSHKPEFAGSDEMSKLCFASILERKEAIAVCRGRKDGKGEAWESFQCGCCRCFTILLG